MDDDALNFIYKHVVEGTSRFAEKAGIFSSSIGFSGGKLMVVIMPRLCWFVESMLKAGVVSSLAEVVSRLAGVVSSSAEVVSSLAGVVSSLNDFSGGWASTVVLVAADDVVHDLKGFAESMSLQAGMFLSSIGFNGSRLLTAAAAVVVLLTMGCDSGVLG